jgi:hypothetical protein
MPIRNLRTGEVLQVHPHCLIFFIGETGHEDFADAAFPVFGMGGCALLAAAIARSCANRGVSCSHRRRRSPGMA